MEISVKVPAAMQCGIGFGKEKGVVSEVGNAGSFGAGSGIEQDLWNFGK